MTAAREGELELEGREAAITGRLASMSREEAEERISRAGGRYVAMPTAATDFVIVGQGGPPLGEDGRLTQSLRRARSLQQQGAALRVLSEEEFLSALGLEERRETLRRLYTTAQLARILGVPSREVRGWVRGGLIQPARVVKRLCFFDFREVAQARTLSVLTKSGVTPARLRKSLEKLGAWLPSADRSLAQLEILELGGPVLVRTREGLAEPTGQLRLGFEAGAAPVVLAPVADEPVGWFEKGTRFEEEGELEAAALAYERALEGEDVEPEMCFNLGNVLYTLGKKEEAAGRYAEATDLDPEFVEAWNNLGNVLADLGRSAEAIRAYRRALAIQPDYADAHYNLGEALVGEGEWDGARYHWKAYLREDPASSWAAEVRERLAKLERMAPG